MTPTMSDFADALRLVGRLLGIDTVTYCADGRFSFACGGEWRLTLKPDDAQRIRVDIVHSDRIRDSMWVTVHDDERLAELAWTAESAMAVGAVQ